MAYKPPSQTIVDNETTSIPSSEAVFEQLKLKANVSNPVFTENITFNSVNNYTVSPQLYSSGTKTANFTLDLGANGPCQQVTINATGPLVLTLSNPVTGGAYLLKIVQGATPGTVTWPGTVKWGTAGSPTLSNTTGKIDIINLYWDGTNYFGTYALGF